MLFAASYLRAAVIHDKPRDTMVRWQPELSSNVIIIIVVRREESSSLTVAFTSRDSRLKTLLPFHNRGVISRIFVIRKWTTLTLVCYEINCTRLQQWNLDYSSLKCIPMAITIIELFVPSVFFESLKIDRMVGSPKVATPTFHFSPSMKDPLWVQNGSSSVIDVVGSYSNLNFFMDQWPLYAYKEWRGRIVIWP